MRRKTTTQQIQQAIKDNLLKLVKAEKYNKSTHKTTTISTDTFKDDLDFLCETIFAYAIGWHYEKNYQTGEYRIETGRLNPHSETIITAHFGASDSTNDKEIEQALHMEEMED